MIVAHGIGVVRDLPIPAIYFFIGAAVVLGVSFVLLFYLWRRPVLEAHAGGRQLPSGLSRLVLSRAVRMVLGAISVFLLGLTLATALFGTTIELLNFAPDVRLRDLLARGSRSSRSSSETSGASSARGARSPTRRCG